MNDQGGRKVKILKKMLALSATCGLAALLAVSVSYMPIEAAGYAVHNAHLGQNSRGTPLGCLDCHDVRPSANKLATFKDHKALKDTNTCDKCHSPGGAFDGVNDPVIGAKAHSRDGVYDDSTDIGELKAGMADWCGGCHDNSPAVIKGVTAPNIMGDNVTYGYKITGHKISCSACHNLNAKHMDGETRTYSHDSNPWDPVDPHNYQNGYRLNQSMIIPLLNGSLGGYYQDRFTLCFTCHDYAKILGKTAPYQTNFQDQDALGVEINRHLSHISSGRVSWDSDWDYLQVPDEIIVDNINAVFVGDWQLDDTLSGYFGTDYQWKPLGSGICKATWIPQIPQSGVYKVYVRWPASSTWASDARFTIVYNGGSFTQSVNQQVKGNSWNLLSSFSFVQGTSGYVQLSDLASGPVVADAVKFGDALLDSRMSCPACHNVHGAPNPAMIRHGELISTRGTQDKLPALSFRWYKADSYTPTIFGDESSYGDMPVLGGPGGGSLEDSSVCIGCHSGNAPIKYDRVYQTLAMPEGLWGKHPLPPSLRFLTPSPGSSEVAIDTDLRFLLLSNGDDDMNLSTLVLSLQGTLSCSATYQYGNSQLTVTPIPGRTQCYQVIVNPENNFSCQEKITVTVSVKDMAKHSLTSPSWSFETSADSSVIWKTPQGVHSEDLFYSPEVLIDDHPDTGNFDSPSSDHWVIYDLGQSYQVRKIRFLLTTVRLWTIYVSDDPSDFGSAVKVDWSAAVTGTPPQWVSTSLTPKQGRYLKIFTGKGFLTRNTLKEIDFAVN